MFATAVLEIEDDECRLLDLHSHKVSASKKLNDRLPMIYDILSLYISSAGWPPIDVVSIEGQFASKNIAALRSLCEGVGVIKLSVCHSLHFESMHDFAPGELKMSLAENGQAQKRMMQYHAGQLFGIDSAREDEADAIAAGLSYVFLSPDFYVYYLSRFGTEETYEQAKRFAQRKKLVPPEKRKLIEFVKSKMHFIDARSNANE